MTKVIKKSGGGSLTADSLTGEFLPQEIDCISIGPDVDHRIENGCLVIGDPYQAPVFNAFSMASQPTVLEVGDSIAGGVRNFAWNTTNSANVVADDIEILDVTAGSTVLLSGAANDGAEPVNIGAAVQLLAGDTQTYRIRTSQLQGADITRNFTISSRWAVYSGNNALPTVTEADVEALANKELLTDFVDTFNLAAGGYKWICYPDTFGEATTFIDTSTNLPVAMVPYTTVSITNDFGQTIDYKCHRTLNLLGSNINIAVS